MADDLPQINYQIVSQRLASRVGDLTFQNTQLEVLAEALRDERDNLAARLADIGDKDY